MSLPFILFILSLGFVLLLFLLLFIFPHQRRFWEIIILGLGTAVAICLLYYGHEILKQPRGLSPYHWGKYNAQIEKLGGLRLIAKTEREAFFVSSPDNYLLRLAIEPPQIRSLQKLGPTAPNLTPTHFAADGQSYALGFSTYDQHLAYSMVNDATVLKGLHSLGKGQIQALFFESGRLKIVVSDSDGFRFYQTGPGHLTEQPRRYPPLSTASGKYFPIQVYPQNGSLFCLALSSDAQKKGLFVQKQAQWEWVREVERDYTLFHSRLTNYFYPAKPFMFWQQQGLKERLPRSLISGEPGPYIQTFSVLLRADGSIEPRWCSYLQNSGVTLYRAGEYFVFDLTHIRKYNKAKQLIALKRVFGDILLEGDREITILSADLSKGARLNRLDLKRLDPPPGLTAIIQYLGPYKLFGKFFLISLAVTGPYLLMLIGLLWAYFRSKQKDWIRYLLWVSLFYLLLAGPSLVEMVYRSGHRMILV